MLDLQSPILVVAPGKSARDLSYNLLREIGFAEVDKTCNSADALLQLHKRDYSCVIGYDNMWPLRWSDFLLQIRRSEKSANVRTLMISRDKKSSTVNAARYLGVDGYLLTPYSISGFQGALLRAWSNKSRTAAAALDSDFHSTFSH